VPAATEPAPLSQPLPQPRPWQRQLLGAAAAVELAWLAFLAVMAVAAR
jgi:hypothetical protein